MTLVPLKPGSETLGENGPGWQRFGAVSVPKAKQYSNGKAQKRGVLVALRYTAATVPRRLICVVGAARIELATPPV